MTRKQWLGLLAIALSSAFSVFGAAVLDHNSAAGMTDFRAVYYGAKCLLHHADPYNESEFLRVYREVGGQFPSDPALVHPFLRAVPICINLPTTLLFSVPLALLDWSIAHILWMGLSAVGLTVAAFLVWHRCADSGIKTLLPICILLANCQILFAVGNTAAAAVSLCVIAAWCFLEERFIPAGVVCLAISLAIKPHDGGLVWLYFLLLGGTGRKRALQTLALTAALLLPACLYVWYVAPHWTGELQSNLQGAAAHGDLNDPGPASATGNGAGMVVDLQAAVSIFRDSPFFYNAVSYLLCGGMLILWSIKTLKSEALKPQISKSFGWVAIAAVVPLTMLATYHRPYDTKLLLLAIPASVLLSSESDYIRRFAIVLTTAGVVLTGDLTLAALLVVSKSVLAATSGIPKLILTVLLTRPASLVLLAMAVFYLWIYLRSDSGARETRWS